MITVELHGGAAAVHDHHAGRAGDFTAALAALADARAAGQPTHVVTAITRSNYRVLSSLPPVLHASGVARWTLAVVPLAAEPRFAEERFVPRLAMALPFALHALDRAVRLGVDARIASAPRCLLGPLATRADDAPARAFGPPCEGCGQRARCPGVDAAYLARFGAGELTRQPAP